MVPTVKHQEKVDYLLDKGLNILWSRGYNGTSVSDIVNAAEVPKGSFYFYFKSKEDFVVKALRRYYGQKRAATLELLSEGGYSPLQRLLNYYTHRVTIIKDQLACTLGCMSCNIGVEMAEHSEMIRTTIKCEEDKIRGEIIKVVKEAQELGEINRETDPGQLVAFIEDSYKGMLTSMKSSMSPEPLDNFIYFLKTIILK